MANEQIAKLIADRLGEGLPHPGRPETNESPRLLPLVAFRTAGMPAEMRQHVQNTAQCVGEAIVNLIETDGDTVLLPRVELDQLRAADAGPGASLPVVCRACKQPMLHLRVTNGRAMVTPDALSKANPVCPHTEPADPEIVEATP